MDLRVWLWVIFIHSRTRRSEIIQLYEKNEYNEFIRKTSFHITKISDKLYIKDKIEAIRSMGQKTIYDAVPKHTTADYA